jgi:hypothetical protein
MGGRRGSHATTQAVLDDLEYRPGPPRRSAPIRTAREHRVFAGAPRIRSSRSTSPTDWPPWGRREDALSDIHNSVRIRRQLAARPDAFLPDLPWSLNNQSNRLDLGRREDVHTAINDAVRIRPKCF